MFRTALIVFALSLALAACVQEPRYAPQSGAAGNQQGAQNQNPPCADCTPPDAIMCTAPGAPTGWISVPAGKKPTDICPQKFIRDRLSHMPYVGDAAAPVSPEDNPP